MTARRKDRTTDATAAKDANLSVAQRVISGDVYRAQPQTVPTPWAAFHEEWRAARLALIMRTVCANAGNRSRAARQLGMQRTYLLRLLREGERKEGR